jgi:hypothetical protein
MTAFELSYKNSHQQNPLTIPCGRLPRKWNSSPNLLHQSGQHKEHGQEAMPEKVHAFAKHLAQLFQCHSTEKWTWRRRNSYPTPGNLLPTWTTNQLP